MNNTITLIIIGLYTVVYVVIFFIQKSQIEKSKSVINSMQSFMDIFKVDEVKKYVNMREERMKGDLQNSIKELSHDTLKFVQDFYLEKTSDKMNEIFEYCLISLLEKEKYERDFYINNHFIKTGDIIKDALSELDDISDNKNP